MIALPLRARITAWYCAVLIVSFVSLAWISDYGFKYGVQTTVNDASRANLQSIKNVLLQTAPKGAYELKDELNELAGLWASGGLMEVTDNSANILFQSSSFAKPTADLPSTTKEVAFVTTNLDGVQYRIAMQSVEAAGEIYHVRAAVRTEPFDQALDRFRTILKKTLPVLVLLASLIGYWLSGLALSPVNEIIKTAQGIGVQNLSSRIAVPRSHDELRRLSETLNDMLGRIERSVNRVTQFTADASHDLRTPVALIRTTAELTLRRSRTEDEYREALSHILNTAEDTTGLIENLLALARADAGSTGFDFQRIDLVARVRRTTQDASILAAGKDIRVTDELGDRPAWVLGDTAAIDQVFRIVMENAVKYTPRGGQVSIRFRNGQSTAHVDVRDSGIGIPENDLPHIFERFYRADDARSKETGGAGLGLAIALRIVELHGGKIHAESSVGEGSLFSISLPLASSQ